MANSVVPPCWCRKTRREPALLAVDDVEITELFDRYAGLLEISDANPFRMRTYGYAVSGLDAILAKARALLQAERQDLDVERWLGGWIKEPQPSLGGLKPEELLDRPTGRELVKRVVGATGSGVYL